MKHLIKQISLVIVFLFPGFSLVLPAGELAGSYRRLLDPLMLLDFDKPAKPSSDPDMDASGSTASMFRRAENGLPFIAAGARPFTGYAWDFSQSDCDMAVVNGDHFIDLAYPDHPGRSWSLWFKGTGKYLGHVMSLLGVSRIRADGWEVKDNVIELFHKTSMEEPFVDGHPCEFAHSLMKAQQ